jgi:hypothetical protein
MSRPVDHTVDGNAAQAQGTTRANKISKAAAHSWRRRRSLRGRDRWLGLGNRDVIRRHITPGRFEIGSGMNYFVGANIQATTIKTLLSIVVEWRRARASSSGAATLLTTLGITRVEAGRRLGKD